MTLKRSGPWRSPLLWLLVLFAAELALFDQVGAHRVTGIYPRWNDQIQYLSEAYWGHEYARAHGFAAGLWHTLVNPSAQGTLHDFAAVILFRFTGASRSAALALNMLALIAWQAALFFVIRRTTRSTPLAWCAAALPLCLSGPWLIVPGGAYDFRLDHLALCSIGVTSAAAVAAEGFRSRWGAVAFGLATAVTLLTRFLTGTYFVVIFAALAAIAIVGAERWRRLGNLALSAAIAAVLAGPIFWLNRERVWDYYVIGHYVGPESAIRNQNFGLMPSLDFVWGWLGERHLGMAFGVVAAAVGVALGAVRRYAGRAAVRSNAMGASRPQDNEAIGDCRAGAPHPAVQTRRGTEPPPYITQASRSWRDIGVIGGVFLLAPALVLTLHPQKSEVVLSALVPGVVLLVSAFWAWLAGDAADFSPRLRGVQRSIAAATVGVAFTLFAGRQFRPTQDQVVAADLRAVNTVADYIFSAAHQAGLERPGIAVDHITDALDAQVLRVVCYERHHVWIDFDMKLPTGIAERDASVVQQRLAESDFVILIADDQPFGSWPYDQLLFAMRPTFRRWCDAHLHVAKRFTLWGRPFVLYERAPNGTK